MPPLVLLLRRPDDPDPYEEALRAAGFRARSVPVLDFRFVNQTALRHALQRSEAYGGLIATSPRAVEALEQEQPRTVLKPWLNKPTYAVGPATAHALEQLGFTVTGKESSSADALATVIANEQTTRNPEPGTRNTRPLLFLTGSRTRDVLQDRLRAADVPFETMLVYETHLRSDLDLGAEGPPDWLVFFSPSGLEAVANVPGVDLQASRIAAIGPTTADALRAAGRPPEAVAQTPSPQGLLEALSRATL